MDRQTPAQPLNLDVNAQKNFIRFYKSLGEKPSTTVRFFDRVEYYSVHGEDDAQCVAKIVFKSTANIKTMKPEEGSELCYTTLNKTNFEVAIRELLLVKNYRVEVYTKENGKNSWTVEFRGSPGNLIQFEDVLFTNKEFLVGSSIIAIQIKQEGTQKKVGLACVEQNDCTLFLTEFVDDDFFTELEAIIVLLGPKECLIPSNEGEYASVKTLIERNGVITSICKKSNSASEKAELIQDLNNLLRFQKGQQEDCTALPEMQMVIALPALAAAIKYLDLTSDSGNLGHFELKHLHLNRFVHLDSAAVSALNIFPKPGTAISSPSYRWQSILGVLDRCRTAQGHRLMAQWVKQPLRNEATLRDRHDIVQCLLDSSSVLADFHDNYLKRIPDVLMLTKKLMRKKATLQDLFRIYQVIIRAPRLVSILLCLENNSIKSVICDPLKTILEDLVGLKHMVEQVVDLDGIEKGEYFVKASFDDELKSMKETMDNLHDKMDKLLTKASDDLELDKGQSIKLEFVSHLGYHFRIPLKDDASLRKCKKYRVLDAIKGGVRFTSEKLTDYNDSFTQTRELYEEQQKTIVDEVIRVAVGYLGPLACLNNEIAQIDCLVSFAIAAQSAPVPYIRPKILPEGSGVLKLKDLRHPCLELQESVTFIANEVVFDKNETTMFIITGPNMGGKSTFIRSVGTAVLMAHVGSFVPCSEATISMVDSILGRVGASDNIIKGLSTFMVEMIETSGIIRTATDKSLVIIDELGRGTSTYEGCGIAWSIAEHLAKETRSFTLFATHFHEITSLADYVPTVKNCHMAAIADDENFTLLYQVRPGVMEKSFGIQVARLANFPENVVKMAHNIYQEFDDQNTREKTEEDKELLDKIEDAIEKLSSGTSIDINENDLSKLVEEFRDDIEKLDSNFFKDVAKTVT